MSHVARSDRTEGLVCYFDSPASGTWLPGEQFSDWPPTVHATDRCHNFFPSDMSYPEVCGAAETAQRLVATNTAIINLLASLVELARLPF
jgi:hypothetical protein